MLLLDALQNINTDFLLQNKHLSIITNNLFIMKILMIKELEKLSKNNVVTKDRFCAICPNKYVELIQKPYVYPEQLAYQHLF